ncbi:MAG: hypothetical protein KJ626_09835 [Verrucomicrobia bacterium]|nr:hypothetical protein [Verrucomicrobiota bacterium]
MDEQGFAEKSTRLPKSLTIAIVIISILPGILILSGVNMGTQNVLQMPLAAGMSQVDSPVAHAALTGSFVHTMFEWSAFTIALLVVLLGFLNYSVTGDAATPIIAIALFCSGLVDAFHILASDHLLVSVVDDAQFIPVTWALSRILNAVVLIFGGVLFILSNPVQARSGKNKGMGFIIKISMVFVLIVAGTLWLLTTKAQHLTAQYPDKLITRPWDMLPLVLYGLGALIVFPTFYRWRPSIFTHSLLISMIPQVICQIHMAFGSHALYDSNFNAAHILKIVGYLVPMAGLLLDYRATYIADVENQRHIAERLLMEQQTEEVLTRDRDLMTRVMEHIDEAVSVKDASRMMTKINRAQATLYGISKAFEAVGKRESSFYDESTFMAIDGDEERIFKSGEAVMGKETALSRPGKPLGMFVVSKIPLKDKHGSVVSLLTITSPKG